MTDSMCNEDELIEQLQKLSQIFLQNHDPNSAEVCFRSVVRLCNRCNIFGDKSQDLRNALMDWTRCLQSMKKQDWAHDALKIFKNSPME